MKSRNRIWSIGDPEPADRPDVVSVGGHRFHWVDAGGRAWWRSCSDGLDRLYTWELVLTTHVVVAEDTSDHPCRFRAAR